MARITVQDLAKWVGRLLAEEWIRENQIKAKGLESVGHQNSRPAQPVPYRPEAAIQEKKRGSGE